MVKDTAQFAFCSGQIAFSQDNANKTTEISRPLMNGNGARACGEVHRVFGQNPQPVLKVHIQREEGISMEDGKQIGINIRKIRTAWGLTQQQLATIVHCYQNAISQLEMNKRPITDNNPTVLEIARVFNVTIEDLKSENFSYDISRLNDVDYSGALDKVLRKIIPIVASGKALCNTRFLSAYINHQNLYTKLYKMHLLFWGAFLRLAQRQNATNLIDEFIQVEDVNDPEEYFQQLKIYFHNAIDGYLEVAALEDKDISAAASANLSGLVVILLVSCLLLYNQDKNEALFKEILKRVIPADNQDKKQHKRRRKDNYPAPFENKWVELLDSWLNDIGDIGNVDMYKTIGRIREVPEWVDLAYFYFALYEMLEEFDGYSFINDLFTPDRMGVIVRLSIIGNPYAKELVQLLTQGEVFSD